MVGLLGLFLSFADSYKSDEPIRLIASVVINRIVIKNADRAAFAMLCHENGDLYASIY
jgi:hypothetical protein